MVLSGLLKPSSEPRPRSTSRTKSISPQAESKRSSKSATSKDACQYIHDPSQIQRDNGGQPDLRELNNSLVALAAIFPDIQVEVFREMLMSFDEESRLAVITEALLKERLKWVQGRYRVVSKEDAQTDKSKAEDANARGTVPVEDRFRSDEYKIAARDIAYQEFKNLSHSTVRAVLAEHNHSYLLARPTLIALNAKSWRFSLSSIFSKVKKTTAHDAEQHPLVVWHSSGFGSIVPSLKSTGNAELDGELFAALIVPLQKKNNQDLEERDYNVALELNNKEAEELDTLHDCECCFTSYSFEELTACDEGGHFLCFNCVRHAVNEAVFGQGWARNIDNQVGTLRCIAPMSNDCKGHVSRGLLTRAFEHERGGKDILIKFDERLASEALVKSQLPLVHCPFCSYAEIDELYLPSGSTWRFRRDSIHALAIMILAVGMIPFIAPFFALVALLFSIGLSSHSIKSTVSNAVTASISRVRRRRLGLRFTCRNLPKCGRNSCISCGKAWTDIHICHESSLLALRTQVELAMSLAIKRTCPRCNTSFVKSSGCNKLTCVCGYQMCYVCRKDIGSGEGYRHFCEHFRPTGGGGCTSCEKCDLYRCEDDEVVVKKAKEEAEARWLEKEGGSLDSEEARKVIGIRDTGLRGGFRIPDMTKIMDGIVEAVIE